MSQLATVHESFARFVESLRPQRMTLDDSQPCSPSSRRRLSRRQALENEIPLMPEESFERFVLRMLDTKKMVIERLVSR
ncbi:MAG: hypothetical protein AAGC76_06855 [Luteibacter sp.]|jgi:hypothetical protein|uniref:hypothetical protein n=1 Tax=Luteibacter sp. TaxID=1886636 RepID=UPI0028072D4E|nr:hypothetical protein [Luteibacter sp.]MDQ7995555.1 hypothetical protein [Luteibacter sp.]MDQ8047643.1 hypothetical protein [Luteibacter sp.]